MKAVWISKSGSYDVLQVRETPDPELSAGQIRIGVRASGLNFADLSARQGIYPDAPKPPCVVGYEVAGEVEALGDGVDGPAVGTRVMALTRFKGHADVVCVPALQVIVMPDDMSFEQGAAIPVNYLTAHHMLLRVANLRGGAKVLVHMAAGGVGVAALQICKTVPEVEVFGTSSASKHDFIREQGCDHPIDYRTQDYVSVVRELTAGKGVDIILDALGGKDWKKGYHLLRPVGHLIAFGFANMHAGPRRNLLHMARQLTGMPLFTPMGLMDHNRTVSGVNVGHLWGEPEMLREQMLCLVELFREGKIRPHVDASFSFAQAADAHRRLEERQNVGKVVLVP